MENDLYIRIVLDSLKLKKTQIYYSRVLQWKPFFHEIQVPIWILVPNTPTEIKDRINDFNFIFDDKFEVFLEENLYKSKKVYGKTFQVIYPEIAIFQNNQKIFQVKRITKNALYKAFLTCLEIKFEIFKKKLKNFVDNNMYV